MANKSAKQLAARNTTRLNQTHLTTLAVHVFYILFRALFFRSSFTKKSATLYVLLSAPGLAVEYWLESIARPKYATAADAGGYGAEGAARELKSAGEDLDAKGLTEYLWDVLYWTWACLIFVGAFGDRLWWFWTVIPAYTVWSAYTTYTGARSSMGLGGTPTGEDGGVGGQSKRQAKMEKRGGQRVAYRS